MGKIVTHYIQSSACTYPACIVNGVKFVVHERDRLHTTQSSGISTPGHNGEMYYGQLEEILELTPAREFHQNNQYILATQATQVFYLEDLARRPLHWKVVEHVYHRDVAKSDQDVIHGSSSSDVALSVGLTVLESTDLSINVQSTEVDAPPINEDNANANEDNADFINNEDDVVAHVLDDDDVEVSDDDEVNPSTNVEEMACVAPRSHGGDAGGDPPRRPTGPVPAQCQGSTIRGVTTNRALRRTFRDNREEPLTVGFDIEDQGTFHPLGVNASYLNSFMGEQIRPLQLACEWEEIPHAYKAHILPTLEDKLVVDDNVYTVGERVRLGLELKLRLLWGKRKTRIKAEHFKIHETPDDANAHMPPPKKAKKQYYEDLIETWRKGHSKKNGQFKTEENKARYEEMKAMKDHIRAGIIPFKTD
ncbi:hypothetical protein Tco_0725764 [Tanacetum coccineum]|uniref:Uncharacterized protein n=1 Tax=Tanacetum coccineum TaxID=301880 RepID=A0ABQ4YDT3_9ASTR